ncbi:MAG: hypothetical protein K1X74_12020 [Pirellulales bacterium]|nr:hypothetical protein [Pirellulales bacterium]
MASLPIVGRLLGEREEALVFGRLRRTMMGNVLHQALTEGRLRVAVVTALSLTFWLGLFWLFADAFTFLQDVLTHPATKEQTIETIFDVFFVSLMVMLTFSTAIILYGALYRTREAEFLMTLPARPQRVFLFKLREAVLLSSWGFVLLGTPVLVAYGIVTLAPWHFFALLMPFLMAFVHVPAAIGAILCLVVVEWLPRLRIHLLTTLAVLFLAGAVYLGWTVLQEPVNGLFTPTWFRDILARLSFSKNRLLPSWWLSHGLLESAAGRPTESLMFLTVLIANALFGQLLAVLVAGKLLRPGYAALHGEKAGRVQVDLGWIDRAVDRLAYPLPTSMRLLLVKDLRLFRRDPIQWSQYAIFFSLLAFYFLNIRRLSYDVSHVSWVNAVSFLNLAVVGLIVSIFTSRFVFPLISLEGRRFWILGRLPLARDTILWGKFVFSLAGSLVPALLLVLLSDWMLQVRPVVLGCHLLSVVVLAVGLSGIAVGLGALLPNLREESPSKIAAGFGGTLNQVLSTLYIVAVTALTAVPCHFYTASSTALMPVTLRWVLSGLAAAVLIGALATVWPMSLGVRAFRRLEM